MDRFLFFALARNAAYLTPPLTTFVAICAMNVRSTIGLTSLFSQSDQKRARRVRVTQLVCFNELQRRLSPDARRIIYNYANDR